MLDDDSLFNIFRLYRPPLLDKNEVREYVIMEGGQWSRERWWYKLVHVCKRWRSLILGSASHLGICLVCTYGTPILKMLAHSPPLPIIIDYLDANRLATKNDDEGTMLVLKRYRDRVSRIGLRTQLVKTVTKALTDKFPMLEHLVLIPPETQDEGLEFPKTFRAPRLRHLIIAEFNFPRRSPLLLQTAVDLTTLYLEAIHPSASLSPNYILRQLSHIPQLKTLGIDFPISSRHPDVKEMLLRSPIATHVTLPDLRWFEFSGESAYLEALLPHFTTPLLEKLNINFFDSPPVFSGQQLVQCMTTTKNLKQCRRADVNILDDEVHFQLYLHAPKAETYALNLSFVCLFPNRLMESVAQISNVLSSIFSAVTDLNLSTVFGFSSGRHNENDYLHWRDVLRPFRNVKTLLVPRDLVGPISRSLRPDNGRSPMELLPELRELACDGSYDSMSVINAFAPFIRARKNTDRPVTLIIVPL